MGSGIMNFAINRCTCCSTLMNINAQRYIPIGKYGAIAIPGCSLVLILFWCL